MPHFLNPVAEKESTLIMAHVVGNLKKLRCDWTEELRKLAFINLLVKVEMADFAAVFCEKTRPFRVVQKLVSKDVEILNFDSYKGQKQSVRLECPRNRLGNCFDVINPMQSAEANNCIKLLKVIELLVEIFPKEFHVFRGVFLIGDLNQFRGNVIAVEYVDLYSIFLQLFLYIVSLLPIAAT